MGLLQITFQVLNFVNHGEKRRTSRYSIRCILSGHRRQSVTPKFCRSSSRSPHFCGRSTEGDWLDLCRASLASGTGGGMQYLQALAPT